MILEDLWCWLWEKTNWYVMTPDLSPDLSRDHQNHSSPVCGADDTVAGNDVRLCNKSRPNYCVFKIR